MIDPTWVVFGVAACFILFIIVIRCIAPPPDYKRRDLHIRELLDRNIFLIYAPNMYHHICVTNVRRYGGHDGHDLVTFRYVSSQHNDYDTISIGDDTDQYHPFARFNAYQYEAYEDLNGNIILKLFYE